MTQSIYFHPGSQSISGLAANLEPQRPHVGGGWFGFSTWATSHPISASVFLLVQVKEAMQRIHDRGNIGKLILDVEKTPTPLVSQTQRDPFSSARQGLSDAGTGGGEGSTGGSLARGGDLCNQTTVQMDN